MDHADLNDDRLQKCVVEKWRKGKALIPRIEFHLLNLLFGGRSKIDTALSAPLLSESADSTAEHMFSAETVSPMR